MLDESRVAQQRHVWQSAGQTCDKIPDTFRSQPVLDQSEIQRSREFPVTRITAAVVVIVRRETTVMPSRNPAA